MPQGSTAPSPTSASTTEHYPPQKFRRSTEQGGNNMPKALTYDGEQFQYHESLGQQEYDSYDHVWEGVELPPSKPVLDGDDWREMTGEEIQAEAEEKEEARIGELAVEHGEVVGLLAEGLAAFGIEMPVEEAEAIATMDEAILEDPVLAGAMGKVIRAMAKLENAGISNSDIHAIGLALQE